jgi:hypothetical protein
MNERKCACKHPKNWHQPNSLHSQDPEKFCSSTNGICSKRSCPCSKFKEEEVSQPESLALPGFDAALQEKFEAQAKATADELNRILREPLGNISHNAGNIERDSPLFFGTGDNPTLF